MYPGGNQTIGRVIAYKFDLGSLTNGVKSKHVT